LIEKAYLSRARFQRKTATTLSPSHPSHYRTVSGVRQVLTPSQQEADDEATLERIERQQHERNDPGAPYPDGADA
jgi:hypothetical protein